MLLDTAKRYAFMLIFVAIVLSMLANTSSSSSGTYSNCFNPSSPVASCNAYVNGYSCPSSCPVASPEGICQVETGTSSSGLVLTASGVYCFSSSKQAAQYSGCGPLPSNIASQIYKMEPWYCPINQQVYEEWSKYLPLALLAVLLAFMIGALIVMVGIAAHSERIKNYGMGELYEAVASAIIVGMFLYVSAVMFGVASGITVGSINPYATALNLISNTISNAEGVINALANVYMHDAEYTSFQVSIYYFGEVTPVPSLILNSLYPYITIFFMDPAINIAGLLSDGIMALYAQYYTIVFFSIASIPVFLIPGVIFRAFMPTRAFGGMLIAIAIGFYFVAPSLFAIAYYFTAPNILHNFEAVQAQATRFGGSSSVQNSMSPTSPLVLQVSAAQSAMSSFWLLILFYPLFITTITYAFIVQIANFIGGASRMGGRMRGFI
ncbi:MAG: hypothetical protein ACP5MX_02140 [Candidatus Micrarchaeia archaeon]